MTIEKKRGNSSSFILNEGKQVEESLAESYELQESMKPKEVIKDKEIISIIDDCIDNLINLGYEIDDDIEYWYGDASNTFGVMEYPTNENNQVYKLVLNKYMKNEPKDAIENTIYHELAHYLQGKDNFDRGLWYFDDSGRLRGTTKYFRNKGIYGGHGKEWQQKADNISSGLNLSKPLSRTDSYDFHTGVGEEAQARQRYEVTCKNCGTVCKFERATAFVKNPNISLYDERVNKYGLSKAQYIFGEEKLKNSKNDYYWSCGKCDAKGQWIAKDNKTGKEWT